MKFLISGMGSIGRRHFSVLKGLGYEDVYCVRSGSTNTQTPGGVKTLTSFEEAADIGLDAALITNPTSLHVKTASMLAGMGMALFIEKPLCSSLVGTEELLKLCRDNNVPVLMGYNFLHHPAICFIKELITDGKVGKVISARAQFGTYMPGWHKDEDYRKSYAAQKALGGGVVLTSIHEQNYLTWFFGKVTKIKAMQTLGNVTGIDCEEGAEILMRHESGVLSSIHLNFFQRPYYRNCQIIGTLGTIVWDFMKPEVSLIHSEASETWRIGPGAYELLNDSYVMQMKHFVKVAKREEMPVCDLEDGIRDLETSLKILEEIEN